jgi:hypothetical protein
VLVADTDCICRLSSSSGLRHTILPKKNKRRASVIRLNYVKIKFILFFYSSDPLQ